MHFYILPVLPITYVLLVDMDIMAPVEKVIEFLEDPVKVRSVDSKFGTVDTIWKV